MSQECSAEVITVEGMEVNSLPQRNRRQKHTEEHQTEETQDADRENTQDGARGVGGSVEGGGEKTGRNFEYLDHTADVIVHAWGPRMKEAFEQVAEGMFNYMTDLDKVEPLDCREIEAEGHDLYDLLFHFLDECLFLYGSEYFICTTIEVVELDVEGGKIKAKGYGEKFNKNKHTQGTEIKAITMHEMKVKQEGDRVDVYVLVDI
eukprot:GDKI01025456.1.p1 GENE.GDKI01025456.1~~GDKI01025456.1.p1  ORF type:complete len:241 (-),score=69.77 GDKI01025456.1:21-635(-)